MSERDLDERIGRAVRAGAASVTAPERLHERVAEQRAGRRRRPAVPRFAMAAALAFALAVGAVLIASGAPTVQDVAAAGLAAPTRPAPVADPRDPTVTDASVDGLAFPSYAKPWGWKPIGARTDTVAGRRAVTVIYTKGDRGIHYTIVAGDPLSEPEGARVVSAAGRRFSQVRQGRTSVVAWERDGRTCVLASRTVDADGLVRFASWR